MKPTARNKIGLWTSTSLVVGNMIGSGLFMLPAALAMYGGISLVGWLISSLGAFFLALVFSWLSRMVPVATGGPYAYTREGFGEFPAFLVAWGYWISIWCTNAGMAVAFVSYLSVYIPALARNSLLAVATGLAAIWLLTWINSKGIRVAGKVQLITTLLKLTPLLGISIAGLFFIHAGHFTPFNLSGTSDLEAIITTTTLTFYAFMGLECATIPAGSIENPEKTISRSTLLGTGIATLVYVLGTISIMGVISPEELRNSNAPFADAAMAIWGTQAKYWVGAGAIISTFGALNGWIVIQGQIPAAAAGDKLFPRIFGITNKHEIPIFSLVIGSVLVSILMMMNFSRTLGETYKFIILLSSLTSLVAFLFSTASFVILSRRNAAVRFGKIVVAAAAFLFSLWAIAGSGKEIVYWGFLLLMAGIPFYVMMRRGRDNGES
ncbi:MAG TPA: amino acid permease [Cyclobacteriaceae bacterium]|nr:amino acid permease [Cyclobacteriaceae bacterium]